MQHLFLLKEDTRKAPGLLERGEIENMIFANATLFTSFIFSILIKNIGI